MFLADVDGVTIASVMTMSRMCGRGRCCALRTRISVLSLFSFNLLHSTQVSISLAQASTREKAAAVSSRFFFERDIKLAVVGVEMESSNDVTKWVVYNR